LRFHNLLPGCLSAHCDSTISAEKICSGRSIHGRYGFVIPAAEEPNHGASVALSGGSRRLSIHALKRENIMKKILMLGVAALFAGSAFAQNTITPSPDRGPTTAKPGTEAAQRATTTPSGAQMLNEYVDDASMADMFEIESSNLALKKSKNAQVQQFAKHMVEDHTKSSMMLKDILAKENITSKPAEKLDTEKTALLKKLQDANENEFSRVYLKMQVDAHQQALGIHQNYAAAGNNQALMAFAKDAVGVVRAHLDMVKNLEQNVAAR
jgi:putative membrane protein